MLPLQRSNELVFQLPSPTTINSNLHEDQNLIFHQDLLTHYSDHHLNFNTLENFTNSPRITSTSTTKKVRKSPKSAHQEAAIMRELIMCDDPRKQKQITHRIVEKQRRQQMSSLYSILRRLLPLEHIKGKRSISDHMQETTNYLKNLKKSIKELEDKRNDLKRQSGAGKTNPSGFITSHSFHITSSKVTVSPCHSGVEILITSVLGEEGNFSLSKLMNVLLDEKEGLDVINYLSTRVCNNVLHTIKAMVVEPLLFDQMRLRRKLSDFVN